MSKDKFNLVTEYPVTDYRCGARAGDCVRLRRDITMHDHTGAATGEVYHAGEIWSVLRGAAEEPVVVWLRQADGETHTWNDDEDFLQTFEILPREPSNQAMPFRQAQGPELAEGSQRLPAVRSRKKSRWFATVAGSLAGVIVLLLALIVASEYANRHANFAFGEKAQRYQIEGKPEAFVLEQFGEPAFITRDANVPKHILVYVPCRWSFYPSYCKIGIDERTGTVSGWMINSD